MFDKEAIQELREAQTVAEALAAVQAATEREGATGAAALPDDYQVHDLEKFMPFRRRARGAMSTSIAADFARYCDAHREEGAAVFVEADAMKAKAVLNLGNPDEPGHADNLAVYAPKKTAAYLAMLSHCGNSGGLSQKAAAEFLEDWRDNITCIDGSGTEIPTPKAVAAVRRITIETARKLESEVASLSETRSAMEKVTATSVEPIPAFIHFKCVPYLDLAQRTFALRLGILTGQSTPMLQLRIQAGERHAEEMAQELAGMVRDAIGDAMPVHIGTYNPAT